MSAHQSIQIEGKVKVFSLAPILCMHQQNKGEKVK